MGKGCETKKRKMDIKEEGEWESTKVLLVQLLEFENYIWLQWGFPSGSGGKESACNAGDLGSIPGSGRSHGERNGNRSSILAWRIPWTEATVHGVAKSWTQLSD